ncbi:MAG: HPr kinase/phosphatase C-terminal domain-containing protein [Pseudomonadota bacterium]
MQTLHASAVAFDGQGVLLTGPSGSGKSSLALELIAFGGVLVADDQVVLEPRSDGVWLVAPEPLEHRVEARGVGILQTPTRASRLEVVVDMSKSEDMRLPPERNIDIAGATFPLLRKVESPSFAAMLIVYLKGERLA